MAPVRQSPDPTLVIVSRAFSHSVNPRIRFSILSFDQSLTLDGIFFDVDGKSILQGAFLRVNAGQICGLFGRNGSGKSTLLKIAAAQITPTSGRLVVNGEIYVSHRRRERFKNLSYLPQDSILPKQLRVRHVLNNSSKLRSLRSDPILSTALDTYIGNLSGGERRYLELHLILSLGRAYLLLDEPFSGIAPIVVEQMCLLLRAAAAEGRGILISDHTYHTLVPLVQDAYLINQGQCRHLDITSDFSTQLRLYRYLPPENTGTLAQPGADVDAKSTMIARKSIPG